MSTADFDEFFVSTVERALAVARRFTADHATAEDLVAESYARAYARWPTVRSHPHPDAWVLRTMANLAIDRSRRKPVAGPAADVRNPDDAVVLHTTLVAALARLPKRQRAVVTLRYLADMPERDVADALSISPGSVKTHLSRGLDRLRIQLVPELSGEMP